MLWLVVREMLILVGGGLIVGIPSAVRIEPVRFFSVVRCNSDRRVDRRRRHRISGTDGVGFGPCPGTAGYRHRSHCGSAIRMTW